MDIELTRSLVGAKKAQWKDFLSRAGLDADEQLEATVLIWDEGEIIATGSRMGNLLKCIAVDPFRQGEGLTATLLTQLRQDAFAAGHSHLFLYTKPKNEFMFSSLFFYSIAKTDTVLLMENRKGGIQSFLNTLPEGTKEETVGAAVMNCNPFTKGHRYLIETAAKECDRLYVFVLSEDKSEFSAADRMEMVKLGTADIPNVTVLPTGPYLISSATFPTYFLQDRESAEQVHCLLDIEVFSGYYAPRFGIRRRYVGTEPLSQMTNQYNTALKAHLPQKGIDVREIPRLEQSGTPVSASAVRKHLQSGDEKALSQLLPETTFTYLKTHGFLK
ncbi:MAG: [Oscillospiraceae bacterium]|nr:[citrate (pro-3S)-lyase] ligase [Oscillospiraceae bacterium]